MTTATLTTEYPSGDDVELSEAKLRKLKGGHIHSKHLVPLNLFLKSTVYDKMINQESMNRILRAFNVELNDRPSIKQY